MTKITGSEGVGIENDRVRTEDLIGESSVKELVGVPPSNVAYSNPLSICFRLLRVKQWSKNFLIFAAYIFSYGTAHRETLFLSISAFFAMSLVSSATYIVNDWRDVDKDRAHPKKRFRPIASGAVSVPIALTTGALCLIMGLGIAARLGKESFVIVLVYLLLQVLYNLWLKKIPVADVYIIATGFVLRAALGAAAINVLISGWLLFCTGALALMLGFGKRRNEFITQGEAAGASRSSLVHYNQAALDGLVVMFACSAAMCYGIYSMQSATATKYPSLIITAPFVFYGITRYVLLVFIGNQGGEPEDMLFRDKHILSTIVLFLVSAAICVSGFRLPLLER
jgi:4-hydroxybenzoate polyprenyltransferase